MKEQSSVASQKRVKKEVAVELHIAPLRRVIRHLITCVVRAGLNPGI